MEVCDIVQETGIKTIPIEKKYKKDLHHPDNHGGVITQLEPDILESEVKWVLGSITMNKVSGVGVDDIAELFQILIMML